MVERSRWPGRAVGSLITVAVVAEVLRVHGGVAGSELASSWQLVDLPDLRHHLVGSIWYLHTQPPLHNVVVGAVVAWSPFPAAGTLFGLYALCLLGLALVLHELLVRWGLPSLPAGVVAGFAVANPSLLHTITIASYEVPLAFGLASLVLLVDRHLRAPGRWSFVAVAAAATALTMTRSLFHPIWLVAVLVLVAVVRPVPFRALALGALIPVVVVGGWMVKNEVLFQTATLSSWDGFNLQRGVTNPMTRAQVERAVRRGQVSSLALVRPWQSLDAYQRWVGSCRPHHHQPAVSTATKRVGTVEIANFDDECYLPLYAQARHDALALVRRHPGTYLARRIPALALSHDVLPLGQDPPGSTFLGERRASTSWMDRVYGTLLARQTLRIGTGSWDQSLVGTDLVVTLGWTLVAFTVAMVGRTGLAAVRLLRRRGAPAAAREVVWVVAGGTFAFVVFGGDLVELGENGRFRTMVDPLVLVLLVSEAWALASRGRGRLLGPRERGAADGDA